MLNELICSYMTGMFELSVLYSPYLLVGLNRIFWFISGGTNVAQFFAVDGISANSVVCIVDAQVHCLLSQNWSQISSLLLFILLDLLDFYLYNQRAGSLMSNNGSEVCRRVILKVIRWLFSIWLIGAHLSLYRYFDGPYVHVTTMFFR